MKNALSSPSGSEEAVRTTNPTQPDLMSIKPSLSTTRSLRVSFPQKPVVFLDIVVKRFTRSVAASRPAATTGRWPARSTWSGAPPARRR